MGLNDVKLPELGENIEFGDVVAILVSVGDRVRKDQALIEVESEKATVEIPSPAAGAVREILVKPGDRIRVGQPFVVIDLSSDGEPSGPAPSREGGTVAQGGEERPGTPAARSEGRAGEDGTRESAGPVRATGAAGTGAGPAGPGEGSAEPPGEEAGRVPAAPGPGDDAGVRGGAPPAEPGRPGGEPRGIVPAGPSARRLARELGLDIRTVSGSGPGGRISLEDVKEKARLLISGGAERPASGGAPGGSAPLLQAQQPELPDFAAWGEVTRHPMGSLRRTAARTTRVSWAQIPHVTQFDRADVTELESQRKALGQGVEATGGKLTVTVLVIRVAASALRRFERFNASLDAQREEVVYRKYVNIGVAVDTERGLVVPVIRDADRKSLRQISFELSDLAEKARSRKIAPDQMSGAGFNVTNLGGFGTTYFTPIVTWPHAAVLGIGKADVEPVFRGGQFVPRRILPLSVSYDHRLIDGADAARFLRWIAEALENPLKLLLEG